MSTLQSRTVDRLFHTLSYSVRQLIYRSYSPSKLLFVFKGFLFRGRLAPKTLDLSVCIGRLWKCSAPVVTGIYNKTRTVIEKKTCLLWWLYISFGAKQSDIVDGTKYKNIQFSLFLKSRSLTANCKSTNLHSCSPYQPEDFMNFIQIWLLNLKVYLGMK